MEDKKFTASLVAPNGRALALRVVPAFQRRSLDLRAWTGLDQDHERGILAAQAGRAWQLWTPESGLASVQLVRCRFDAGRLLVLGEPSTSLVQEITADGTAPVHAASTAPDKVFGRLVRAAQLLRRQKRALVRVSWNELVRDMNIPGATEEDIAVALRLVGWRPVGRQVWVHD